MKPVMGAALASMVAAMFATACGAGSKDMTSSTKTQTVKCAGINSCAGQGACAGTLADGGMHSCAGMNGCAGQGWIEVASAQECTTKGGRTL